jgi:hypothetical protein
MTGQVVPEAAANEKIRRAAADAAVVLINPPPRVKFARAAFDFFFSGLRSSP